MNINKQVECGQCEAGWVMEENGEYTSCYHCQNTGMISQQQKFWDRIGDVANSLAYDAVMRLKKEADSHPDGEGWELHAAENGLHEHEYTQIKAYEYECRIKKALIQLGEQDNFLLEILVDRLDPDGKVSQGDTDQGDLDCPVYTDCFVDDIPF